MPRHHASYQSRAMAYVLKGKGSGDIKETRRCYGRGLADINHALELAPKDKDYMKLAHMIEQRMSKLGGVERPTFKR